MLTARLLAITICSFVVLVSLAGCGSRSDPAPPPTSDGTSTPTSSVSPVVNNDTQADGTPNNVAPPANADTPPPLPAAPAWVVDLASDDAATRQAAATQLAAEEQGTELLRDHLLRSADAAIRRGAAFGLLSEFDTRDQEQTAAMLSALADDDEVVRRVAMQAVSQWGQADPLAAEVAILPLEAILKSPAAESSERSQAARILGRLGAAAQPALVRAIANDAEANVRKASLAAVMRTNPSADAIVTPLTNVLKNDTDPAMRRQAAMHLQHFGGNEAAHSALAAAFGDSDREVRIEAATSLGKIGTPALEFTIGLLDDPEPQTRLFAIFALGKMGRAAEPAIARLRQLTNDSNPNIAKTAAGVIRVIEAAR